MAFQLGKISLEVASLTAVGKYIEREFSVLDAAQSDRVNLDIREVPPETLASLQEAASLGNMKVGTDVYQIDYPNWRIRVSASCQGATLRLEYAAVNRGRRHRIIAPLPRELQRLASMSYMNVDEENGKGVLYSGIDQALQLAQVQADQTFVHASALEREGAVTVVGGWGGAGKTSAIMSLVRNSDYKFLSDDLGVMSSDGTVFRSPKRIQVYPYNLGNRNRLPDLGRPSSYASRVQWRVRQQLKGGKGVRRRVSAEGLFGAENVAKSGAAVRFIHLERGHFDRPRIVQSSPAAVAKRTSFILMYELEPLSTLSCAAYAVGSTFPIGTEPMRIQVQDILERALNGVECLEVQVPTDTKPSEIAAIVDGQ